MATKHFTLDFDQLYQRHLAGESTWQLAEEVGLGANQLRKAFNKRGYRLRRSLDLASLYTRYSQGESSEVLAAEVGISGASLRRRFYRAGYVLRDLSEAQRITMGHRTAKERSAMAAAAHAAVRGMKRSHSDLAQRAAFKEAHASKFSTDLERELAALLTARGEAPVLQKAIDVYNADLALGPIAVEIFGGSWHSAGRHAARFPKRTQEILNCGWHLVIIWVELPSYPLRAEAADYLVSLAQFARRNPSAIRQYRVIRGTGEIVIRGCAQDDHFPMKLPKVSRQKIRCEHLRAADNAIGML